MLRSPTELSEFPPRGIASSGQLRIVLRRLARSGGERHRACGQHRQARQTGVAEVKKSPPGMACERLVSLPVAVIGGGTASLYPERCFDGR